LTMILNYLRIIVMTSLATRSGAAVLASTALLAGSVLSGCGALSEDDGGGSGNGRRIVAAFYPLQYVAERVAGEHFEVDNLTQAGQEPHDLELKVKQTAELAEARLVVFEHGFQPAVDAAVEENAEGDVLDVADVVDLQPFAEHEGEEHEGEEHEDEAEGHEDEHEHGDLDPHFWQDPLLMADLGDEIAKRLADLDSEHADDYAANADALRADMEKLDREFTEGLSGCERDTVVVNHDAFGYLARYGLHLEPISGFSPGAEPTPADLGDLQELIKEDDITTVFSETLVSPKTAETLADDLGIKADVLDPIEGLTDETKGEDYVSLMRSNLQRLTKANGC
jgi:zinc transport system substrate-binding protein